MRIHRRHPRDFIKKRDVFDLLRNHFETSFDNHLYFNVFSWINLAAFTTSDPGLNHTYMAMMEFLKPGHKAVLLIWRSVNPDYLITKLIHLIKRRTGKKVQREGRVQVPIKQS